MPKKIDNEKLEELLTRGVDAIYPSRELFEKRLRKTTPIRIYLGFDPTGKDLHMGHALQLRKLRQFQDLGHEVILLVGSFTGMIGDPTDKSATRNQLTKDQVLANAATYKKQAAKILRFTGKNPAKLKFNHSWLAKLSFAQVIELASNFTVQQMLERDMFDKRHKEGKPIHMHEFFYPLMQGYDSVAMDVDAELGGSDQMFNMMAGRTLMKKIKKEKFVVTLSLLTNSEGKKMSKSEGGMIAITDSPKEMFGKVMALSDDMIIPYFTQVTAVPIEEVNGIKLAIKKGLNPKEAKVRLGLELVTEFHSKTAATKAAKEFESLFTKGELPTDIPEHKVSSKTGVLDVLKDSGLTSSKSEARRLITQGAIKIDGTPIKDQDHQITGTKKGIVLQRGKRKFARIIK